MNPAFVPNNLMNPAFVPNNLILNTRVNFRTKLIKQNIIQNLDKKTNSEQN